MNVSSRTPEGFPGHCPLCGALNEIEFSDPAGDAPCPSCGHLLWLSARLLSDFQNRLSNEFDVPFDQITPEAAFDELGADSLEVVELIMELETECDLSISDDQYARIRTVGDAIRFIEACQRKT
ncbi:MAG: acyl carrier protein [Planctomycetaceae bacterium]|nr:acyl carrier protein [Planctomycetaceae bacterium]